MSRGFGVHRLSMNSGLSFPMRVGFQGWLGCGRQVGRVLVASLTCMCPCSSGARFVYDGVRQQRRSPEHLAGLVEVLEYGDGGAAQTGPTRGWGLDLQQRGMKLAGQGSRLLLRIVCW